MIINISEAANLAIHALTFLANNPGQQPVATGQVAQNMGASENHLSKVFQRLTKAGLVKSVRGPHGGFSLAWKPEDIMLLEIYEAIDGPLTKTICVLGNGACDRHTCVFGDLVTNIHDQVEKHFTTTSLADLIERSGGEG